MFQLPFKVYGAVKTFIKLNVIKQNEEKNQKSKENHPLTRQIKYKRIDFAPCNKSITANKLLSTNLERFLRRIKSRLRVNSAKYIAH